jgi:hypothetical protein
MKILLIMKLQNLNISPPLIRPLSSKVIPSDRARFQMHWDSKIQINCWRSPLLSGQFLLQKWWPNHSMRGLLYHKSSKFSSVLDTTLCDTVHHWFTSLWFSQGTLISSTNKTDHHDLTELLWKNIHNLI